MRSFIVPVAGVVLFSAICVAQEFSLVRSGLAPASATGQPCPPAPPKLEAAADLPAEAKALLTAYKAEVDAIRQKAEDEVQTKGERLAVTLKTVQDQYTRDAKLDEAVAVRDLIRRLTAAHLPVRPNPGNLTSFREQIGQTFYFEVAGRTTGSLYGTEVYTHDSDLATAAVHIGALKNGESGIVQVTIVASPSEHVSSEQNGVRSTAWGTYSGSYTVQRWVGTRAK